MNAQTKNLLIRTIDMFKVTYIENRASKIQYIEKMLKYENDPNCFFEPTPEFITAAKIFIRIVHKIPVMVETPNI